MTITANDIKRLLAQKYYECIYVTECKTGKSYHEYGAIDFWAMAKSWTKPLCVGCEIKVDHGDFINDTKYPLYMRFCNQFFFVCPPDLIKETEVGADCGLIYVNSTGRGLKVIKKAPCRQMAIEDEMTIYKHIVMARSIINNPDIERQGGKRIDKISLKAKDRARLRNQMVKDLMGTDIIKLKNSLDKVIRNFPIDSLMDEWKQANQ